VCVCVCVCVIFLEDISLWANASMSEICQNSWLHVQMVSVCCAVLCYGMVCCCICNFYLKNVHSLFDIYQDMFGYVS
jgi:hypothetical protein